jgi:hypothetical protein
LRSEFITSQHDFSMNPNDRVSSLIGSHTDRIEPEQQPMLVYTVAMRFNNIPFRLL